jgi:hypothetical protein
MAAAAVASELTASVAQSAVPLGVNGARLVLNGKTQLRTFHSVSTRRGTQFASPHVNVSIRQLDRRSVGRVRH